MDKLIFSQSGVYRLQQLAKQVHHITGIRHKLSDPDSVVTMLQQCARSNHQVIQTYFTAFTSELDSQQLDSLTRFGVQSRVTH